MDNEELPTNLEDDNLSEETKTLISSLPSDKDWLGKLYNYHKCWYYPILLQGVLNFQRGFKPQDSDIIIAWLKALTIALLERSKKNHSFDDLHLLLSNNPHGLVPFLEVNLYSESSKPDLAKLSSLSSRRLLSTHMHFQTLQVTLKDSPCKIVYVCRDVKDVIVSQWYFICASLKKEVDKSTLESVFVTFESFCTGIIFYGPIWEQVSSMDPFGKI